MSATTPLDDGEIHDLVLLFANSRIPRGSDAFQSLVGDFVKHDSPEPGDEAAGSDSSDSSAKEPTEVFDEVDGVKITPVPKSALKSSKSVRIDSPKTLSHVHWPDDMNSQKVGSPQPTHHARLYMKTTPKPILKHEDQVMHPGDDASTRNIRRFSSPHHV